MNEKLLFLVKNILSLDLNQDIIFFKDNELKYLFANDPFCNIFNIKIDELLEKSDNFIIKDETTLNECEKSDKAALENGFAISTEVIDGIEYKVLKLKVNLDEKRAGILGFAKLKK